MAATWQMLTMPAVAMAGALSQLCTPVLQLSKQAPELRGGEFMDEEGGLSNGRIVSLIERLKLRGEGLILLSPVWHASKHQAFQLHTEVPWSRIAGLSGFVRDFLSAAERWPYGSLFCFG